MTGSEPPEPPRRRHRGLFWGSLGAVLLLLVGIAVLDGVARSYVQQQIETEVRSALALGPDAPLVVRVGGFSVLMQLVAGELDRVDLSAPRARFGTVSGSLRASAGGVPLDASRTAKHLTVEFGVDAKNLKAVTAQLGRLDLSSLTIGNGEIQADARLPLVPGLNLPVGLRFTPSATAGRLALTPTAVRVAGKDFSKDTVTGQFGRLGSALFQTRSFCIANYLPEPVRLQRARVAGDELVLSFTASAVRLDSSAFTGKGVCPPQ